MSKSQHHKKVTLTTGPIYIPVINVIVPNNKLVVTLKNPTDKKLEARVSLGICPSPVDSAYGLAHGNNGNGPGYVSNLQTFEIPENEISLGSHKVDPMSCLRIERTFDDELLDSVIRLEATGDFKICEDSCSPICGLLEISSVVGFNFTLGNTGPQLRGLPDDFVSALQGYYVISGLLGSDPQTHVPYADWVLCDDHSECECDSHSDSHSKSDSCSDSGSHSDC